jgi:chorismate mutase
MERNWREFYSYENKQQGGNNLRSLEELRQEIEEIDKEIIKLIERRTMLAKDIIEAKKKLGLGPVDKERREDILGKVSVMAVEKGLDPALIK